MATNRGAKVLDLDVLVIDNDRGARRTIKVCLEAIGCRVDESPSAPAARAAVERKSYELVLLDLKLGKENGLDLLPLLRTRNPSSEIVVVTAAAALETAVEAIRRGARDYVPKPLSPGQLQQLAERAAAARAVDKRLAEQRERVGASAPEIDLHSESPRMNQVLELVARAATHDAPILLRGERGTGRAVLARRLHALSARAGGPFVIVESRAKPDALPPARGGTLFVDEVALLSPALQDELLRAIEAGTPRIVAASAHDLTLEARSGRVRAELAERLLELAVPSLRERREDILPLARRFLAFYCKGGTLPVPELTMEAESALTSYSWPGNLRELLQVVERAALLRNGIRLGVEALPETIAARATATPYLGGEFTIEAIEREHILRVLAGAPSQEEASRILGIDTSTLWRKRKRYETA